ncbi:MAG: effector-associated domain EAD1-containing protein [Pleurocapsa sp. MO_226.B13]|nr:effector-associated domain EAD1-containing protein [Pleurocapsa sp. MO_226.B13]
MSLPGIIIKEIQDALVSAFPVEDKLIEMLSLNLNIKSATYPNGEDYENRVFKVLEKLDSQERIIELINAAYQANDGNYMLQQLHKQIPKISLLNIIYPFEKEEKYFQPMKQSYFDCCLKNFSDWEHETVKEILDNLDNPHQEQADQSPMAKFVAELLNLQIFPDIISDKLEKWGQENNDNFAEINIGTNKSKNKRQTREYTKIPYYFSFNRA